MPMKYLAVAFALILVMVLGGCTPRQVDISPSVPAVGADSEATPMPTATLHPASLSQAKPYLVVEKGNLVNESPTRTAGLWFITAPEANTFEEYAQTAIQAALDLYSLYRNDSTTALLIPQANVRTPYAQASYAADGKGAEGMTGSAPAIPMYWKVRAMNDRPYDDQELAILQLWQEKMVDFPSRNPLSSLSYDEQGLRQYVADTLQVPYSATQVRSLKTEEYEIDESFLQQIVGPGGLPNIAQ